MKIKNDIKIGNGDEVAPTNGVASHDESDVGFSDIFESGRNSVLSNKSNELESPTDTIPFNIEGIQTVIKNHHESSKRNFENGTRAAITGEEVQRYKEENKQLRAALKEASRVNQQWRNYHDQRQGYVQKLLASLQELQQATSTYQGNGRSTMEVQRLRDSLKRAQKEHSEHVQLLQLQVRAHRDDWEAERSEKNAAEMGRLQAEHQLQIVQKQLVEATSLIAELEERLKLCKCFAGSNTDICRSIDKMMKSLNQLNGSWTPAESVSRVSPNFSSTNSLCSTASRSSSISKDISSCSSPTIMRNNQCLSPYGLGSEGSRNSSPSIRHSAKPSLLERNDSSSSISHQEEALSKVSSKSQESSQDFNSHSKSKPSSSKCKGEGISDGSLTYFESKGARPKSNKSNEEEEERQAKHRARSILASALPMSPSSSKPSSPVTVTNGTIPKGYIPITSTVLTPIKFRSPYTTTEANGQIQFLETNEKQNGSKGSSAHSPGIRSKETVVKTNNNRLSNTKIPFDKKIDNSLSENQNGMRANSKSLSPKIKKMSNKCSTSTSAEENDNKQLARMKMNTLTSKSSCDNTLENEAHKSQPNDKEKPKPNKDNGKTKDTLEIKTASKMKQNTKSLIVTNNQNEKCSTNYASITVMPGPSSALFSHTQTTSTTSSRSSSPGISLTTFALNANGQGVPGAIFFALGTDTKTKTQQASVSQGSCSSGTNNQDPHDDTVKLNAVNDKDVGENSSQDRIVNSTWVQLTDNEGNNIVRNFPKTTWRTARAVPSHKLNSVRKTNSVDVVCSSSVSPTFHDELKQNDSSYFQTYNCLVGNSCPCSNAGHTKYQQNFETRYQTSLSPPPSHGSCSRTSPSISLTQHLSPNESINGSSPTICLHPQVNCTQQHAEADLRSMASKNISSAILSYECGNKACVKRCSITPETQIGTSTLKINSGHYLICPSCQKLFHHEHSSKYEHHTLICGGPKYVDM